MKLTGTEQYHWERAGYFVRRGAIPPDEAAELLAWADAAAGEGPQGDVPLALPRDAELLDVLADAGVFDVVSDLFGEEARLAAAALSTGPCDTPWRRDPACGGDEPNPNVTALGRRQENVVILAAIAADESLLLVPGSNVMPVSREAGALAEAAPFEEVPGQVRVRLTSGDCIFLSGALLQRTACLDGAQRRTLRFALVSTRQPEQPPAHPWAADRSALLQVPGAIRPWLR